MPFRHDIQALRGIAVLLVLFYHAGIPGFSAGYLGVDVFFVISGFLMTGIIARDLEQKQQTLWPFLRRFYMRRIRRLLPAAYVTFFITMAGAYFFLTQIEYGEFAHQLAGAVTFNANHVLMFQDNYFDNGAELKPLLHTWSLSIEEQFYFFIPLLLFFVVRKYWIPLLGFSVLISLGLCFALNELKPSFTFYTLTTRAWELGFGSLAALAKVQENYRKILSCLCWPASAALIIIPAFMVAGPHPGLAALLVCTAVLVLLVGQSESLNNSHLIQCFGKIGDISYSLYLVHWPLFAFANNIYLFSEVPVSLRLGLMALSFLLAVALYRYIERPCRYTEAENLKKLLYLLGFFSLLLIALPYILKPMKAGRTDYTILMEKNAGLDARCHHIGTEDFLKKCLTSEQPEILVWGDSNAMHLMDGIVQAVGDKGVAQATYQSCSPILGLEHIKLPNYPQSLAKGCREFKEETLAWLAVQESIKLVIVSSPFEHVTDPSNQGILRGKETVLSIDLALREFKKTVDAVRALGKKAVLVSAPPRRHYNLGLCLERKDSGLVTRGGYQDCPVNIKDARAENPNMYEFLDRVEKESGIPLVNLADYLCDGQGVCRTTWDGALLYRDGGHFTHAGARILFKNSPLMKDIYAKAR
jgi:peptidoglycan/LPS O-acetylase OafA/YrhL